MSAASLAAQAALHAAHVATGGKHTRAAAVAAPTAVLGRSSARTEEIWERAQRLLGVQFSSCMTDADFDPQASAAERVNARALRERVMKRVRDSGDPERLAVALNWLQRYRAAYPHVVILHQRGGVDDLACARRNEASFAAIELFIRETGSVKRGNEGAALPHDTIAGYISAMKSTAAAIMGVEAVSAEAHTIRPRLGKQMRLEEPSINPEKLMRKIRVWGSVQQRCASFRSSRPSTARRWTASHDGQCYG